MYGLCCRECFAGRATATADSVLHSRRAGQMTHVESGDGPIDVRVTPDYSSVATESYQRPALRGLQGEETSPEVRRIGSGHEDAGGHAATRVELFL